jgi:hypothetical protein
VRFCLILKNYLNNAMKLYRLVAISLTSLTVILALHVPARAGAASSFFCGTSNSLPTTFARTERGDIPVIRWTSNYFADSGWTPERRCAEVSDRFQTYYQDGTLNYLTTGIINGLPVICTAEREDGPCENLLLTLKSGVNAGATLQELLAVRVGASGPMDQSSPRVYINMEEYLETTPIESVSEPANYSPSQPASEQPGLW